MVFSPFAQPADSLRPLPSETIHLVDTRLQLVYEEPNRSEELGLVSSPEGKISLVAQVDILRDSHHSFIMNLRGFWLSFLSFLGAPGVP